MSETARQYAVDVLQSPKTASAVSGVTVAVGLGEKFQLIPWGAIAAAIGVVLSTVMIIIQLWRFWLDRKGARLEREKLHLQIAALRDKARLRREAGQPLRRDEDAID